MRDSFGKRNREDPQSPETKEVEENSLDRRVDPEKVNVPFQNNFDKRQINRAFQRDKGDNDDERNDNNIISHVRGDPDQRRCENASDASQKRTRREHERKVPRHIDAQDLDGSVVL